MISSKLSEFSKIMNQHSGSMSQSQHPFQQLQKSNVADIGSVLLQSSRKSKFMTGLKIVHKQKIQPVTHVDSNTIKLIRGALPHRRDLPVKQGKLILYSNSVWCFAFGSNQEEVHCNLARNVLAIYSKTGVKYLCFDTTNVRLITRSNAEFELLVQGTQVHFVFKAESELERDNWARQIDKCITIAHSYGKQFSVTISTPSFQQKQWVLQKQFVENCNSGDILLFQSSHTYGKLQQFITFSDYDHVGIVLKNKKNQVVIFESSSSEGVSFMFWKQMIYYRLYQGIPRLAWRRLNMERSQRDISVMEDFVMDNLHKQFELNVNKVFRFQSEIHKTQEQEKKRTYFCSELVAAFYKKLGILDQQKATSQYWPVSFSDTKELNLLRGRLEPERIIVFEEEMVERKRK